MDGPNKRNGRTSLLNVRPVMTRMCWVLFKDPALAITSFVLEIGNALKENVYLLKPAKSTQTVEKGAIVMEVGVLTRA